MSPRLLLFVLVSAAAPLLAGRLPISVYTTADGLPARTINCIVRDSRGFLWFCTADGLVRFDGYTFARFHLKDGIPNREVTAFAEARDGALWVGTYDGAARFEPNSARTGGKPFVGYPMAGVKASRHITALVEDRQGAIWCGTRNGLYRKGIGGTFQPVDIGLGEASWKARHIKAMAIDGDGGLWVGTEAGGLYRRGTAGAVKRYEVQSGSYSALLTDRRGRIWAGHSGGICVLTRRNGSSTFAVDRVYDTRDGLPNMRIKALIESRDGTLWAGTEGGVAALSPGARRFQPFTAADGLADVQILSLGLDPEGNLWIATGSCLMRLARYGFVTYGAADGLGGNQVVSILEDRSGRVCAVSGIRRIVLNVFDGERFTAVQPRLVRGSKPIGYMGWGIGQTVLQDHLGEWWIPTGEGLCRFPLVPRVEDLARVPPRAVYGKREGLPGDDIFRVFEDSRGDLWIATVDTAGLARWRRQTGRFEKMGESQGFQTPNPAAAFAEDHSGNIWAGLFWGGLARYRNGRWRIFTSANGVPEGSLWSLRVDHRGRLWIASSSSGLARVDDPAAETPGFARYTTRDGLSSDLLWSLAEDRRGLIYVGTERGVDELDPETGRIRQYSSADGLAPGDLAAAFCDRSGALWFGATTGLSRLRPEPERKLQPPPIRITGLRIAGDPRLVSALGETDLSGLKLNPGENHLEVEFASLNFRVGGAIRYQYRLEGDSPAWSEPAETRSVNLAGIAPGGYRFQVRALSDGLVSAPPAQISFRVLPPVWRRWWSMLTAALLSASVLYFLHRYRVARLVEVERVRTRIAMDLHDDIGASLSQIAILSEVARREAGGESSPLAQPLARVAEISRELVEDLSDLVWAINPRRDHVGDLVQRMRRFAGDLLNSHDIDFECHVPEHSLHRELGADLRRQVFLTFKESVHNIARHSGCRRAQADLALSDRQLRLAVSDDGTGFNRSDPPGGDGQGLASMRKRAVQLGGSLDIDSRPGHGTTIVWTVPIRHDYPNGW